jgi:hypothetical protein
VRKGNITYVRRLARAAALKTYINDALEGLSGIQTNSAFGRLPLLPLQLVGIA